MSFAEILEKLPTLTISQRQFLIHRALELDEPPLCVEDKALIEERLAANRHPMMNLTPHSQQVMRLARKEAERMNNNFVGTEHILLGLIALGTGVAANVLIKEGFTLGAVREEIEKHCGKNPEQKILGHIPYTPRVRKVIDLAEKEAEKLHHTFLGTEHLLLGLLGENENPANLILKSLGMDTEQTRKEILRELDPNFLAGGDDQKVQD